MLSKSSFNIREHDVYRHTYNRECDHTYDTLKRECYPL